MFAIDIDETIACGAKAFARYYVDHLGLSHDEAYVSTITDYRDVMTMPALVRFCRQSPSNMAHFEAIKGQAQQSPEVYLMFEVIDGAIQGTQSLARLGPLRYYTVRKPEIHDATLRWLMDQGFVNAHEVVFCRSSMQKLIFLSQQREPTLLIDDRWVQLTTAFDTLRREHHEIADLVRQYVTLAAFGVRDDVALEQGDHGISCLAMSSWAQTERIFDQWQSERRR